VAFWKRQIRAVHSRLAERGAIIAGRVHNRAGLYASDDQVKRTIQRKRRSAQVLANQLVINELGQEYSLADLAALSPANPLIRRAELMVRLRGFETIAKQQGHVCDFFTITCPGSYHPRLSKSGQLNPNYQPGIGPREAQAHLQKVWSRARAKLHRKGIRMCGFRVAEPHHDGTPHWHMVLFFNEADRRDIRKCCALMHSRLIHPSEVHGAAAVLLKRLTCSMARPAATSPNTSARTWTAAKLILSLWANSTMSRIPIIQLCYMKRPSVWSHGQSGAFASFSK
jgi:hypothetical protein